MSMDAVNPYAAPQHDLPLNATELGCGVWRDGNLLVMRKEAVLPNRCMECNAPAEGGWFKQVSIWFDPLYLLLLPILPLVVVFIAHMATVELGLCASHFRLHQRDRELSNTTPLYFLGGIVLALIPFFGEEWPIPFWWRAPFMLTAGAAMVIVSVRRVFPRKRVWACKIDRDYVWYREVDPDYLAQFPPFVGY